MVERVMSRTVREMTLVEFVLGVAAGVGLWGVISVFSVRLGASEGGLLTEQLVLMTLGFLACVALLVLVVARRTLAAEEARTEAMPD